MSHRRRRKSPLDEFLGSSSFAEMDEIFKKFEKGEMSSGYSINVTQTPEGTKVYAKVSKDTDVNELRQRLQQQYPGTKIEIEGEKPLIREISTKPVKEEKKDEKDKKGVWFKPE